jgi:hypothetical protein
VVQGVPGKKLAAWTGPSTENGNEKRETGTGMVEFEGV